MRYLGIDYGAKRIGIAYSDEAGILAFPLRTIQNSGNAIGEIKKITTEKNTEALVVGEPVTATDIENEVAEAIREFASRLHEETGLPIFFASEFFSSIEASRYAPDGAQKDDAAAAAIILQRFLDANQQSEYSESYE